MVINNLTEHEKDYLALILNKIQQAQRLLDPLKDHSSLLSSATEHLKDASVDISLAIWLESPKNPPDLVS